MCRGLNRLLLPEGISTEDCVLIAAEVPLGKRDLLKTTLLILKK